MIDEEQVRAIARSFPRATEDPGSAHFKVSGRGFAWPYPERVHPKRPRVERRDIFVIRVESEEVKFALITGDPEKYFTTDHYNGYPAVLVRLASVDIDELRELLLDAYTIAIQMRKRP